MADITKKGKQMGAQKDNISHAAGIGPTLTLNLDGKEYTLGPTKIKYLALVQERAASEARKKATADLEILRAAGDLLPPAERADLIREMTQTDHSYIDELMAPRGLQYILFLRLSANHPELTEEAVGELVTLDAISELKMELTELMGLDVFFGGSENEGSDSPPEPEAVDQ